MKRALLRFLRLRERPDPPPGSEPTLETFRSSRKALVVDAVGWFLKQMGALFGILVSLSFFSGWGILDHVGNLRDLMEDLGRGDLGRVQLGPITIEGDWMGLFHALELLALGTFALQFVIGAFLLKLAWEVRWYMVSDESLRIREGLWRTHERTMTVANIQNLTIRQGPLQKLLGIADLEVHTAGGKHADPGEGDETAKNLHVGRFRGIANAAELRDRIRATLRRHRGSGLGGDAEDDEPAAVPPTGLSLLASSAAAELLGEARALRATLERASST